MRGHRWKDGGWRTTQTREIERRTESELPGSAEWEPEGVALGSSPCLVLLQPQFPYFCQGAGTSAPHPHSLLRSEEEAEA